MDQKTEYLLAFDFDGTIGDTVGKVTELIAQTTEELFGPEGKRAYELIGGVQNRAPSEFVQALFQRGNKESMIEHACFFAQTHAEGLSNVVQPGKGVPIEHAFRDEAPSHTELTELFVRAKLAKLLPEVGDEWPKPLPGIKDALSALQALKKEGVSIRFAVLSSGHEIFIRKCFELWGIPEPDILITDDDLRGVPYLLPEQKIKPNVHLLARLHHAWRKARGLKPDELDLALEKRLREEGMMYFGDDELRDGKLALQSDVLFGLYKDELDPGDVGRNPLLFHFTHWDELTDFLTTPELGDRLKEGESIGVLLGKMRLGLRDGRFSKQEHPLR